GTRFRRALIAGCEHGQRARAELNRINVFPVPDGDTGTNLAMTLRAIRDGLRGTRTRSLAVVAQEAAEASILGARGNCGMILSHFLLGLSESIGERRRLRPREFGEVMHGAVTHVYGAIERPVEGTILTVMRESAEEARAADERDFLPLLERVLERARISLARTPDLLPVLRKAGVVDAGAMGFVEMLEGMLLYVHGDPIVALGEPADFGDAPSAAAAADYPTASERYRFCTEALVRGEGLPASTVVRTALHELGDSLVVISTGDILKIHIHTDQPEGVFEYLRGVGRLVTHKAEDMEAQHAAAGRAAAGHQAVRRPVGVVSDTGCDLPEEVVRAHGIHLVPLLLMFEEGAVRDRFDMDAGTFVERIRAGARPTTSQPSPASFLETFERAAEEAEALVVVSLASALSGTFASAEAAAKRLSSAPATVVDSRGASLLQGLLTVRACELGELGVAPDEIARRLAAIRDRSGIIFTVDTFDRLLASGRVGRGRALLGRVLDIKPILELNPAGTVEAADRVRGRERVLPRVMELLETRIPERFEELRFGIVHVACPEVVDEVAAALRERWGEREILSAPATPVIATHIGPGAWGLAWMVE
ncbi:MAG TPA: DegV family protein, partial [Longimicrobiales bacterium]|nr:DegV family protein [Longimicrobiales bacterium]